MLWLYDCPSNMYSKNHERNSDNSTIPSVATKYPSMLSALELRKSVHFRRWLNYPLINLYGSSLLTEMQIEKLIGAKLITCNAIQQTESRKLEHVSAVSLFKFDLKYDGCEQFYLKHVIIYCVNNVQSNKSSTLA